MSYRAVRILDDLGCSLVSDELLREIWETMVHQRRVDLVFYSGGVDTVDDFLEFIKSPQRCVSLVVHEESEEILAMGWLTNIESGTPFAHFCAFGKPNRNVGRFLTEHWLNWQDRFGNPKFRLLMAITPENHTIALRMIKIAGFVSAGTVPQMCYCAQTQKYVPGVISYLEPSQSSPRD